MLLLWLHTWFSRNVPVLAGNSAAKLEVDKQSLQDVEAAMKGLGGKWPSSDSNEEEEAKWREELFKSEVRPRIQEEIRLVVDAEMRQTLHNSKVQREDSWSVVL